MLRPLGCHVEDVDLDTLATWGTDVNGLRHAPMQVWQHGVDRADPEIGGLCRLKAKLWAGDLARGHFRRNGERVAATDAPVQAEADRLYFLKQLPRSIILQSQTPMLRP